MKKFLIAIVMAALPVMGNAAGAKVPLEDIDIDLENHASLQRGMKTFVNYCLGCHSAEFQRYERAAQDLGMPNELVEENLIFGTHKVGEQMTIAMDKKDAAGWFGAPPPDLTLEARLRKPEWIYTYLKSFYVDPSRPWGVNNVVFKDVGMPNVLEGLQGKQTLHCSKEELLSGEVLIDPLTNERKNECLKSDGSGSMSAEEFDKTVYDLVNFMAYMGEPSRVESEKLGIKVLIFLFIFTIFAYLLKKEYWRDIH